ncbi:MAG TPA: glycosyltransferase, partial [Chitinophagaceae bacterium]|nr:glycosyltransferase [Chitinophagaceae bacterium]
RILFLDEMKEESWIEQNLPLIYQHALALLYPSIMEGFGIPVLEAMSSSTAVITSQQSSLLEAGTDAALFVDPLQPSSITQAMKTILFDETLRQQHIQKGLVSVNKFSLQQTTQAVMNVYSLILNS